MTKEQQDTQPRHLQPIRPAYTHNTTSPPTPYTDNSPTNPDVVQVTIYQDPATGKEIVFWEDVLVAFKGALSIRQGARVLPFLRGSDFKMYACWLILSPCILFLLFLLFLLLLNERW